MPLLFWSPATIATQAPENNGAGQSSDGKVAAQAVTKKPDVIFVPTPQEVVDKMLELAQLKKGDVLYDLGCGDGRIVVTAAKKFGVKAIGFDVDPQRIKEANENVEKNGVGNLVTIRQADIFEQDLREANVVTLYLLPELNVRLMPQLKQLRTGSRIVSHDFDMRGAKAEASRHRSCRRRGGRAHRLPLDRPLGDGGRLTALYPVTCTRTSQASTPHFKPPSQGGGLGGGLAS